MFFYFVECSNSSIRPSVVSAEGPSQAADRYARMVYDESGQQPGRIEVTCGRTGELNAFRGDVFPVAIAELRWVRT